MRKQYMQPELEAIDIQVNTMLCTSFGFTDTGFNNDDALAPGTDDGFDLDEYNTFELKEETFDLGV